MKKAKAKEAADGGVAAVDRALAILSAFQTNDAALGLAEIATRTGINKSTILRLAQSLIHGRMLLRLDDGRFRLGSETLRLGSLYQQGHSVGEILLPKMRELARSTGESVVFHVREGDARVCLIRVESDQPIRYHVRVGEAMPLNLGSCGRVLLAFSNAPGEPYESVRRDFHYVSLGERSADTAGIAAPVFGLGQELLGALGVSGPLSRLDAGAAIRAVPDLLEAARAATRDLGGNQVAFAAPLVRARAELALRVLDEEQAAASAV